MTISPAAVRVLGPCLTDTDGDGLYDIFEDVNNDNNLANDDTDGDGIPNYLDLDDDGDGYATWEAIEGADPNGDHTHRMRLIVMVTVFRTIWTKQMAIIL